MCFQCVDMNIKISTNLYYIQVCQDALKSYINLIDYKPENPTGYIYKITVSKDKNYIGSTIGYGKRWIHY